MAWFNEGLCILPFFLVVWSSSTFVIPYIIAVLLGHVDVIFPYISDTGAVPPESCIFGLMTVITAFAALATMYAKYKFMERLNEKTGGVPRKLNQAALGLGIISCFGMGIVATFQETEVRAVHDLGAFLFFFSGVLYTILQSIISFRAYPYGTSFAVCVIRVVIATVASVAVFPTIICAAFVSETKLHWTSEDKDYTLHLASAVSEWTVAFSFVFFFFTYLQEFKQFTLTVKADVVEYI
ncbi:DNA damage-regulated autophagy modulator protein 1 [Chanos chanos]|uniref:DNA damage-regulated autophagy modulator protein 1 n=1 Tax=Chanos chanos TaxID=29144 RepID=A0A6J2W4I0_CHACN|nr:DNA damage-regulated autophagy modulator protein 1 [Chanos chanos]